MKVVGPKPGEHILLVDGVFNMIGNIDGHIIPRINELYKQSPEKQYVICEIKAVATAGPVQFITHASERMK